MNNDCSSSRKRARKRIRFSFHRIQFIHREEFGAEIEAQETFQIEQQMVH
jgi:hypothetical protein